MPNTLSLANGFGHSDSPKTPVKEHHYADGLIGHACMMALSDTIDVADLPEHILRGEDAPSEKPSVVHTSAIPAGGEFAVSMLENTERRLIEDALIKATGNQSEAARILRIGRDALRYKMKKYNLAGKQP